MSSRTNEQTTTYLVHGMDQPKGRRKTVKERPSRVPTFGTDVMKPTIVVTLLVFLGSYSLYIGFWPGTVTAGAALIFFLIRLWWVFDFPQSEMEEEEVDFQEVGTKVYEPSHRTVRVNASGRSEEVEIRNAKVVKGSKGDYQFSGRQLDQLVAILDDPEGDGKIRRETSGLGRGLEEIGIKTNKDYRIVTTAWEEQGIIGKDDRLTARGERWARTQ